MALKELRELAFGRQLVAEMIGEDGTDSDGFWRDMLAKGLVDEVTN